MYIFNKIRLFIFKINILFFFYNFCILFILFFVFSFNCFSKCDESILNFKNEISNLKKIRNLKFEKCWKFKVGYVKNDFGLILSKNENIIYTASVDGLIYAIDILNGSVIWKKNLNFNIISGPVLYNDFLIVTSFDNNIWIFDSKSGNFFLNIFVEDEIVSCPIFVDYVCYVATTSVLYAIDLNVGDCIWKYSLDNLEYSINKIFLPIVVDEKILFNLNNKKLISINLLDGTLNWIQNFSFIVSKKNDSNDYIFFKFLKDKVCITDNKELIFILNLYNGNLIWKYKESNIYYNDFVLSFDENYIFILFKDGNIKSLNSRDGKEIWKVFVKSNYYFENIFVIDDFLLVFDLHGYVYFLNKNDGHFLKKYNISSYRGSFCFLIEKNFMYLLNSNCKLYCYKFT